MSQPYYPLVGAPMVLDWEGDWSPRSHEVRHQLPSPCNSCEYVVFERDLSRMQTRAGCGAPRNCTVLHVADASSQSGELEAELHFVDENPVTEVLSEKSPCHLCGYLTHTFTGSVSVTHCGRRVHNVEACVERGGLTVWEYHEQHSESNKDCERELQLIEMLDLTDAGAF